MTSVVLLPDVAQSTPQIQPTGGMLTVLAAVLLLLALVQLKRALQPMEGLLQALGAAVLLLLLVGLALILLIGSLVIPK
jgi:drug/metabolite transporter (DMT)-like permease